MGYRAAAVDGSTARYDGLADWYDEVAAPSAELSSESLLDLLYCRDGLCLDLGCGTGLYGPILERAGRTVIGVELSQDQLRHAKHREVVTAGDASKLPFRDRSFDDVFGVHPCFNGPCVESRDDGARVVHPNYRQSGWHLSAPWWSASGIRSAVGVRHRTLAELFNDLLRSPLRLVRVEEPRDDAVPAVLALVAERPETNVRA